MANDLVEPAQLEDFPGAPFTDSVVDAVAARIRSEAGWHIAPERPETLTVGGASGPSLVLSTLKIVSVTEVRDVTDPDSPVVITDWRVDRGGTLTRASWRGDHATFEVDLTHGHASTPPDLLPLMASIARESTTDLSVRREIARPYEVERAEAVDQIEQMERAWSALDPYRAKVGF